MNLSENQKSTIRLMRGGYELSSNSITHSYGLYKQTENDGPLLFVRVHRSTFKALMRRKLIKQVFYDFPIRKYTLTVKGKIDQIEP